MSSIMAIRSVSQYIPYEAADIQITLVQVSGWAAVFICGTDC